MSPTGGPSHLRPGPERGRAKAWSQISPALCSGDGPPAARVPFAAVNAFYVVGGLLAAWAVVVATLGIRRPTFPGRTGERVVGLISIVLAVGAVAAAAITASLEEEGKASEGAAEPGAGAAQRLSADRGGALAYDRDRLEASAGRVTIEMANPSSIRHNVSIAGNGVEAEGAVVGPGGTSTVSANLDPGTYDYYCTVLGHRAGGMGGTLTVR